MKCEKVIVVGYVLALAMICSPVAAKDWLRNSASNSVFLDAGIKDSPKTTAKETVYVSERLISSANVCLKEFKREHPKATKQTISMTEKEDTFLIAFTDWEGPNFELGSGYYFWYSVSKKNGSILKRGFYRI